MPKVKFDSQQIKQLLRERVELVALGVCCFLGLVFLAIGVMGFLGASSPDAEIVKSNEELRRRIASESPPPPAEATSDPAAEAAKEAGSGNGKDGPKDPPKEEPKEAPKDGPKGASKELADGKYPPLDPAIAVNLFPTSNWYDSAVAGDTKRRSPKILPIDVVSPTGMQLDALVAGVRHYNVLSQGTKIETLKAPQDVTGQTLPMPLEHVRTEHLVVFHGTLLYKEQLELYRKALRFETVEDLLRSGLVPVVSRLSVWRRTVRPDGTVLPFHPVYDVFAKDDKRFDELTKAGQAAGQHDLDKVKRDDKEVWVVSAPVHKLLKEAVYDQDQVRSLGHALAWGGASPLPLLAHGKYPKVKLEKIEPREEAVAVGPEGMDMGGTPAPGGIAIPKGGVKMPGPVEGGAYQARPQGESEHKELKRYPRVFADRLRGKVNYFNPYGVLLEVPKEGAKTPYPGGTPNPMNMPFPGLQKGSYFPSSRSPIPMLPGGPMDMEGANPEDPNAPGAAGGIPDRIVVRFVDAGLQPGHSYQYYVTVWMENPNLGWVKEVAYPKLANLKEIPSQGVYTPWVTVPSDYNFYVVNERKTEMKRGLDPAPLGDLNRLDAKVPVQIHKWADEAQGKTVAHWSVAERLTFARGEPVQRERLEMEVPIWNTLLGDFEMGERFPADPKKKIWTLRKKTLPVSFAPNAEPPVVVDFAGDVRFPGSAEGNLELLLVTPDGRLMVRSSRDDSDPTAPTGKERLERLEAWKTRLQEVRNAGQATTTGSPMTPMPMGSRGP
jgi:hypothetical protein